MTAAVSCKSQTKHVLTLDGWYKKTKMHNLKWFLLKSFTRVLFSLSLCDFADVQELQQTTWDSCKQTFYWKKIRGKGDCKKKKKKEKEMKCTMYKIRGVKINPEKTNCKT